MARRPLIVGNWKMNGLKADGLALARTLANRMRHAGNARFDMALCPPFTLLAAVGDALAGSGIALGAQDCHAKPKGAHTGDVSAPMLKDLDCRFAIVGHSERRADHGETDAVVKAKAEAALAAGLATIVCIGERESERDAGRTLAVVKSQLAGSLPSGTGPATTVVAYEPVWAIGSGRTPTAAEIAEVHALIRAALSAALGKDRAVAMRVLYGGSVKAANAKEIFAVAGVDGGLVGGASLNADEFWAIAESCP